MKKYITFYRKYRPIFFKDIINHKTTINILQNSLKNKSFSHAYLFHGPRGVGKTSVARLFSKSLNCVNLSNTKFNVPCNICNICINFNNNNLYDIFEIDSASFSKVDQIRSLISKISFSPIYSKYKIYIFDEVHMLSNAAFNSLLKVLEEPPLHVIFIFVTTKKEKIPFTILSRCQTFNFSSLKQEDIFLKLKSVADHENISYSQESLFEIIKNSDGSLRDALNHLEKLSLYNNKNITLKIVNKIFNVISKTEKINLICQLKQPNNFENIFLLLEKFRSNNYNFKNLTLDLIYYFKDYLNFLIIKKTKYLSFLNENDIVNFNFSNEEVTKILYILISLFNNIKNNKIKYLFFELAIIEIYNFLNKNKTQDKYIDNNNNFSVPHNFFSNTEKISKNNENNQNINEYKENNFKENLDQDNFQNNYNFKVNQDTNIENTKKAYNESDLNSFKNFNENKNLNYNDNENNNLVEEKEFNNFDYSKSINEENNINSINNDNKNVLFEDYNLQNNFNFNKKEEKNEEVEELIFKDIEDLDKNKEINLNQEQQIFVDNKTSNVEVDDSLNNLNSQNNLTKTNNQNIEEESKNLPLTEELISTFTKPNFPVVVNFENKELINLFQNSNNVYLQNFKNHTTKIFNSLSQNENKELLDNLLIKMKSKDAVIFVSKSDVFDEEKVIAFFKNNDLLKKWFIKNTIIYIFKDPQKWYEHFTEYQNLLQANKLEKSKSDWLNYFTFHKNK